MKLLFTEEFVPLLARFGPALVDLNNFGVGTTFNLKRRLVADWQIQAAGFSPGLCVWHSAELCTTATCCVDGQPLPCRLVQPI
jgi:hypothetical protein